MEIRDQIKARPKRDKNDDPVQTPLEKAMGYFVFAAGIFDSIGNIPPFLNQLSDMKNTISNAEDITQSLNHVIQLYDEMKKKIYQVLVPLISSLKELAAEWTSGSLKNISSAGLDVKAWQIGKTIETAYNEFERFVTAAGIHAEIKPIFTQLQDAMHTIILVDKDIAAYQDQKGFADLNYILNKPAVEGIVIEDPELKAILDECTEIIKTHNALWFEERTKASFLQFVFPFTKHYLDGVIFPQDAHSSNFSRAIDIAEDFLKTIKNKVIEEQTTIQRGDDSIRFYADFKETNVTKPFYSWSWTDFKEQIRALLSGKEVYLRASIYDSPETFDAIKFTTAHLELSIRGGNESFVASFKSALSFFKVRLTHDGNSFYRFANKYYVISNAPQQIEYSFANKEDGTPEITNGVYNKLAKGDFTLSPYTTWKFQITKSSSGNFDMLKQYLDATVDLTLTGKAMFIDTTQTTPEDLELAKYYKSYDIMTEMSGGDLSSQVVPGRNSFQFVKVGRHIWARSLVA